jgi:hypothetical protein
VSGINPAMTAGTKSNVTVIAKDISNNTITTYVGTIHFTSTDPQAVLPPDYTFTPADAGAHTFSLGVELRTASTHNVYVNDTVATAATGTQTGIVITPAPLVSLVITGLPVPPATTNIGFQNPFTITAKDPYGNTDVNYTGTVRFTSTDTGASLPLDYTFTAAADQGFHLFTPGVTFVTIGTQTITVTDTVNGTWTGTSPGVTVNP